MKIRHNKLLLSLGLASATLLAAGCQHMNESQMNTVSGDGDVSVPGDYRNWAKFVPTVDKAKAGQVREIYINDAGLQAERGGAFPNGTTTVMEIYKARKTADGALIRDSDGRLRKGELAKVFVMSKGEGWGMQLPTATVSNGDWLYGAYEADSKTPATSDFTSCRGCHAPLAGDDYIARYDEHFDYK
jgi:hemoglobin